VLAVPTDVTREVALLEVFDVVGEVGALGDEVLGGKGERGKRGKGEKGKRGDVCVE